MSQSVSMNVFRQSCTFDRSRKRFFVAGNFFATILNEWSITGHMFDPAPQRLAHREFRPKLLLLLLLIRWQEVDDIAFDRKFAQIQNGSWATRRAQREDQIVKRVVRFAAHKEFRHLLCR